MKKNKIILKKKLKKIIQRLLILIINTQKKLIKKIVRLFNQTKILLLKPQETQIRIYNNNKNKNPLL